MRIGLQWIVANQRELGDVDLGGRGADLERKACHTVASRAEPCRARSSQRDAGDASLGAPFFLAVHHRAIWSTAEPMV